MRRHPTDQETKFLRFIIFTTNDRHYPPSVREIADHMGFTTTATVDYYIKKLVEAGYMGRVPNQPRAIWVIP